MVELLKSILAFLGQIVTFLIDLVQWLFVKILVAVFDALIAVLSLIPVPEWLENLSGNIAAIDPGILFFAEPFQLGTGVAWVVSAYVLRFLIRRIPVIG